MSNYRRYFINKNPIFITMVTYNRNNILIENIELLRKAFEITKKYYLSDITESMRKRGEKGIWQRRYYDHVIRNEKGLWKHIDYIHFNSVKHYDVAPKDWKFSSFNKFVKNNFYDLNWCNYDDKNKIFEIDLE